jgi:hypothetical protein
VRVIVCLLLAAVGSTVGPLSGALAARGDDGDANPFVEGVAGESGPGVRVTGVESVGEVVRGPGAPEWLRACSWFPVTLLGVEGYFTQFGSSGPTVEELRAAGRDPDERWAMVFCRPGPEAVGVSPSVLLTGVLAAWRLGDPPPQVFMDWLVATAYASVELPVQVGDSAPLGTVTVPMITQLSSWLWISDSVWVPRSATASVFGVSATVTATPVRVWFEGAEREWVDCGANTGRPYNFNLRDDQQHSNCVVTYHHSSAVGDWSLSSTIEWEASYTCSVGCPPGRLPDYVVTNTRPVVVAEIQAVLVGD